MRINEKPDFYRMAWDEIENNAYEKSILSRAFAHSDGDENKTKAAYLRLRVAFLEEEYAMRLEAEKAFRAQMLKKEIRANEATRKANEQREKAKEKKQTTEARMTADNAKREERGGFLVCGCPTDQTDIKVGDVIIKVNDIDIRGSKNKMEVETKGQDISSYIKTTIVRGLEIITSSPTIGALCSSKLSQLT